jgi:hypothetical protein
MTQEHAKKRTDTRLATILLRHGQSRICELLHLSPSEVSRKVNGDAGWTLEQLAAVIDDVGAQVIPGDEDVVVIPKTEWLALRTLSRKALEPDED